MAAQPPAFLSLVQLLPQRCGRDPSAHPSAASLRWRLIPPLLFAQTARGLRSLPGSPRPSPGLRLSMSAERPSCCLPSPSAGTPPPPARLRGPDRSLRAHTPGLAVRPRCQPSFHSQSCLRQALGPRPGPPRPSHALGRVSDAPPSKGSKTAQLGTRARAGFPGGAPPSVPRELWRWAWWSHSLGAASCGLLVLWVPSSWEGDWEMPHLEPQASPGASEGEGEWGKHLVLFQKQPPSTCTPPDDTGPPQCSRGRASAGSPSPPALLPPGLTPVPHGTE